MKIEHEYGREIMDMILTDTQLKSPPASLSTIVENHSPSHLQQTPPSNINNKLSYTIPFPHITTPLRVNPILDSGLPNPVP